MKIINDLNIKKQAEELGVSVWQAPSFLFLLMGVVVIASMVVVYFVARFYNSPEILIISEILVSGVIFTLGSFVVKNVEMIARANKMKSEFVSIASHQLKTPLSQINWALELLFSKYQEGMTEKQMKLTKEISTSNSQMSRLVNDLLDVARLDQGRLFLSEDNVDFLAIAEEVYDKNISFAKQSGVKLEFIKPDSLPYVVADKRRMKVSMDNLVSNAIKYTKDKGYVGIKLEEKDGNIQFCVKDTGVGIPEDEQGRLYEKFYRCANAAKLETDGTGLGLFITKNFVEQSGGELWFKSIEEVGSNFCFSIPVNKNNKKK